MYSEYILMLYQNTAPKPPKYQGLAAKMFASTSPRRQDLVSWYTSGFQ